MSYRSWVSVFLITACCSCVIFPSAGFGEEPDERPLQFESGYLLIRIIGSGIEKDANFEFTHWDTGFVVKAKSNTCNSAGPNARMCIIISPAGRYFWSRYESEYRLRFERSIIQDAPITRELPSSADDTFEIVPGVINYIGDWTMRVTTVNTSQGAGLMMSREWSVDVSQNFKTIERLLDQFPEYADNYQIYLSMMGKKAVSLQEFLKIVQEQTDQAI